VAKRQKRFQSAEEIKKNIPQLLGKNINIVFIDGTVLFARLTGEKEGQLQIANMRLNESTIALNKISEIILDYRG